MPNTDLTNEQSGTAPPEARTFELERLYTLTESAAFAKVPVHLVESEIADSILSLCDGGRLPFASLAYLRALSQLRFRLDVPKRKQLLLHVGDAVDPRQRIEQITLSEFLVRCIGPLVRNLRNDCRRFLLWKARLVRNAEILGGAPLFPGSRLSVFQAGSIRPGRGSRDWAKLVVEPLLRRYTYLTEDDLDLATQFVRAYPPRRVS